MKYRIVKITKKGGSIIYEPQKKDTSFLLGIFDMWEVIPWCKGACYNTCELAQNQINEYKESKIHEDRNKIKSKKIIKDGYCDESV